MAGSFCVSKSVVSPADVDGGKDLPERLYHSLAFVNPIWAEGDSCRLGIPDLPDAPVHL